MPTQQRRRSNQAPAARRARQVTRSGCEQGTICRPELRLRDLPAEKLELVAQHEQLDVLYLQATAATDKRTKQSPEREVEKGEGHVLDPPSPRANGSRHQYWRPSGRRAARIAAIRDPNSRRIAWRLDPQCALSVYQPSTGTSRTQQYSDARRRTTCTSEPGPAGLLGLRRTAEH